MWEEWGIGGHDHDDRAAALLVIAVHSPGRPSWFHAFFAHRHPGDLELPAAAVIRLDQHPNRVAAHLVRQPARGGPGSPFETVANHARSPTDVALSDRSGLGLFQGLQDV